ncbi:MAG: hypothetical protein H6Q17_2156 [Bacteroidetes bacterium]|jgi:hypothetical protein|nr:hypothetical protein [Bacteroidota bacterium]
MNIHIARQIARKLRRQRAFSKLTKRSTSSKENKDGDASDVKTDENDVKI